MTTITVTRENKDQTSCRAVDCNADATRVLFTPNPAIILCEDHYNSVAHAGVIRATGKVAYSPNKHEFVNHYSKGS